ncbi:hypothetical protein SELMODRAFT_408778 [Selaginella moellendorffii]|uniref:Uncharacterized protein n=1 Tax=Selaginella moellendorffii TaxID=88036 RepID=D8R9Y2_SELML|nr:hypothetical protein SELMODRAFT_408778 [Selaginella moellendorffii]
MVDPDPSVSMQKPNGSREGGNVEPIDSVGEAASGGGNKASSAIGGRADFGGGNEASSAIDGGANLGGGNGGHVTAIEGHKNEVETMLKANIILNEQPIVKAEQNSYLKITQVMNEGQKNLELQQIKYLNHCPSAPMYTTSVFLKLLTSGKKLGIYEPKFHCPIARE